jgi:hypothetical protein
MSTPSQNQPAPENAPPLPALFGFHDFIRPGEQSLYAELDESVRHDLAPVGFLEHNLVDEIRRAMWRLRRCGLVEESLAAECSKDPSDPMQQEKHAKIQLTVDRARSQAHRLLHKCTAELRRLQTDRKYRDETFEAGADISEHGLTDWRTVRKGVHEKFRTDYHRDKFTGMAEIDAFLSTPIRRASSFCKTQTAA